MQLPIITAAVMGQTAAPPLTKTIVAVVPPGTCTNLTPLILLTLTTLLNQTHIPLIPTPHIPTILVPTQALIHIPLTPNNPTPSPLMLTARIHLLQLNLLFQRGTFLSLFANT